MTGRHRKRKPTTTDDYGKMLGRMLRAYGNRIGQDPAAGLAHLRDLEQDLADAVNLGIYTANKTGGHSINALADMLGVSKQAVHKRVKLGEQVARERERAERRSVSLPRKAAPRQLPPGSTGD